MTPAQFQGVLHFFTETGTEGGSWAFQDEKFMGLDAGQMFSCSRCGRVWNKDTDREEPKPVFTYWREGDGRMAGFYGSDTYEPDGDLGPHKFDANWNKQGNETSRQCAEQGHGGWVNMYPDGKWSYEGLHELGDGDMLTVYDGEQVLFDGVVQLPPRQDPYADGAYVAGGCYTAHRRPPVGTDEEWWFSQKRATLTRGQR